MHDYFLDYIIRKSYFHETTLWGDTRRIKMYFHVVYGGGRRRYGGARRNSLLNNEKNHNQREHLSATITSCTRSFASCTRRSFQNPTMPLSSLVWKAVKVYFEQLWRVQRKLIFLFGGALSCVGRGFTVVVDVVVCTLTLLWGKNKFKLFWSHFVRAQVVMNTDIWKSSFNLTDASVHKSVTFSTPYHCITDIIIRNLFLYYGFKYP